MKKRNLNSIPGMIELGEQDLLVEHGSDIQLNDEDVIIEYGCFFGRSTNCIIEGLKLNKTYIKSNKFILYDSFQCKKDNLFSSELNIYAKKYNVDHLIIEKEGGVIDFRKIFEHFTLPTEITLEINQCNLHEIKHTNKPIALMHIDAPKYYEEFKYILDNHFIDLKLGSIIVFQDFFYHWSATLVACIEIMFQNGFLVFNLSKASSLSVTVIKKFNMSDINAIDVSMKSANITDLIGKIIQRIIDTHQSNIDRIDQFLPRLMLCNVQYLYEMGNIPEAMRHLMNYIINYPTPNHVVYNDLFDLAQYRFSRKQLYQLDHTMENLE